MADVVASFRARSLPVRLGGAHVRASNGTDTGLDGTLSTVSSNVPAFDRDRGVVLEAGATQLLYNTGFAGAVSGTPGTKPTNWTTGAAEGGTVTVEAAGLGNSVTFAVSSNRHYWQQSQSYVANTTYTFSLEVLEVTGTVSLKNVLLPVALPSGSSITAWRLNGVAVADTTAIAVGILEVVVAISSTAGTALFRVGCGCDANSTGAVKIAFPQSEAGSFRTSYIYNTSTSAALVRQPSYISSTLSALGVASQTNEYTVAVAVRMAFPSTASPTGFVFATLRGDSTDDRITFQYSNTAAIRCAIRVGAVDELVDVTGLTWATDQTVILAVSKGAANGAVVRAVSTVATSTSAHAKSAFTAPITQYTLNAHVGGGSANWGTYAGALIADRAYSQAELEALSVDDFLPTNTGTYLEDDWVDTNGTLATAHTIRRKRGSEAWTYTDSFGGTGSSSSITVQSNRIQFASANSSIVTDLGETDYTLEFPWHIGSTSGERLAIPIRWTDINNQYYLNLREPNDDWTIYKVAGGVQTTVATGSYTFNTSTTYMVKIVVSGTSVHAYINDVSLTGAQTMDTSLTATKAGLGTAGSTTAVTFGTVRFHNNVQLAATGDIDPDGGGALTLAGFVAAPDEAYYRAIAADLDGTPTTSSAVVNIPLLDFQPGGDHETTRWRTDYELVLSDGLDTLVQYAQVDPILTPNGEDFTLTSGASVVDAYNPVPGAVGGDDFFTHWHNGDGVRDKGIAGLSDAGSGYMVPSTLPAQGRRMAYDVSAGAWLGYVDTALFSLPSTGVVEGIVMAIVRPVVKSVVEAIT